MDIYLNLIRPRIWDNYSGNFGGTGLVLGELGCGCLVTGGMSDMGDGAPREGVRDDDGRDFESRMKCRD